MKTKKDGGGSICVFHLILVLICSNSFAQENKIYQLDTLLLSQYKYTNLKTNNGSHCICSIHNISTDKKAIAVNTGAAEYVQFNDSTSFNGIHVLEVQQQIIAVANFKGSQLIVLNLSPYKITIVVTMLCP